MAIATLKYVQCDSCGDPAQPGDSAGEARRIARSEGFKTSGGRDICKRCQPEKKEKG